ncbi:nitroreductase/quinone reductase family protein [Kitasatospora sp. A2-31]|uniref:nitroreductase/quinone reductase family protein n=1 Tax=Kitasatospora sp. A2-31 TaxID=2916414 RepID=UPI001EEDF42A|nr:nitroreductase/quinone reductase family protein [Kitasatospora sp. A2-31]MCG6499511.1 nitroreductase family deazaflavin-dependent oxidoreductase [Kitasatospora sp. A2-31]
MSVERPSGTPGPSRTPRVPPRWFVRLAWSVHRGIYRVLGRRVALWRPGRKGWGTLRLTTTGRRTGRERSVVIGYFEDGPNLVALAMNGWGDAEPAWWLNLQAQADAVVDLVDGRRPVRAHAAAGEERQRLWARWLTVDANLDAFAALRPLETAVVVLAPRSDASPGAAGTG